MGFKVGDLITLSLQHLGALGVGETPSGDMLKTSLTSLQLLIESINNEDGIIFANTLKKFALISGKKTYTWGIPQPLPSIAPDWVDTDRPLKVLSVNSIYQFNGTLPVYYPVKIFNIQQYQDISVRDIESTIPNVVYFEFGFPYITAYLYPLPSQNLSIELSVSSLLSANIMTTETMLNMPQGYNRYLTLKLAQEVASLYGMEVPRTVAANLMQAESNIKITNLNNKGRMFLKTSQSSPNNNGTNGNFFSGYL